MARRLSGDGYFKVTPSPAASLFARRKKTANVWAAAFLEDVREGLAQLSYPSERFHLVNAEGGARAGRREAGRVTRRAQGLDQVVVSPLRARRAKSTAGSPKCQPAAAILGNERPRVVPIVASPRTAPIAASPHAHRATRSIFLGLTVIALLISE
jgi:hypothetical protein